MCVERRPVHHGITRSAVPAGMPAAAVAEAGDVSDEDLIRAERVPVRAPRRWLGYPLPAAVLDEVADHPIKPRAAQHARGRECHHKAAR